MSTIKGDLLKIYIYKIKTLETSIKSFNSKDSAYKGHIINYEEFKNLKKSVEYDKNKNIANTKKFDIKDSEKKIFIKELEFKTSQYLMNMLLNGNKYIIVDSAFFKAVCEKGKENSAPINYEITKYTALLNIKFKDNKTLGFDNKKDNILEESNLKSKSGSNFEEIKKLYQNIKTYYDFEIKVQKGLSEATSTKIKDKGYLIEKDWIDKWKEEINYDEIKKDYLISNKREKDVRDKLIYIFEEKKLKYLDLADIKNKELKDKQKIEECLKKNSLVLVSSEFILSFKGNPGLSQINYNLYENTLEIDLGPNNSLQYQTKNNIIISSDLSSNETKNSASTNQSTNKNPETQDNKFANDILTILINIYLGEKEFFDKVENSKSNINKSINDYSLVNSDMLSQFKQFFSYDTEIKKIVDFYKMNFVSDIDKNLDKIPKENKIYFTKISDLKKDFPKKFQINNFFEIKSNSRSDTGSYKEYSYPSEFQIIQKNLSEKLGEALGNKDYINIEQISLGFNTGNIIFKPTKGKFFDETKNFAYIYSFSKETNGVMKYNPEVLISFETKNAIINNFSKLIQDENLIDSCINNIFHINSTYICKAFLMNKKNPKLFIKSGVNNTQTNQNEEEKRIDKLISNAIKLNDEYSKLKKLINEQKNDKESECYLVKKNFIEAIEEILYYNEIENIILQKDQLLKKCQNEKEKLEKIKNGIKADSIKALKESDDSTIAYELDAKELNGFNLIKDFKGEKTKNAFYYKECKIITKEIFDIIKDTVKKHIDKIKKVSCLFDKGEIIILIKDGNDEVINVGNLEEGIDLKIKYIIQKESSSLKLSDIFSQVKTSGYDFIKKNINSGKITHLNKIAKIYSLSEQNINTNKNVNENKNTNITNERNKLDANKANSENLLKNKEVNNRSSNQSLGSSVGIRKTVSDSINIGNKPSETIKNEVKIDEKLKSLILLAINQKKDYTINSTTKSHKVYLINKDLEKYKFTDINSLLNENNNKIFTSITSLNKSYFPVTTSKEINEIAQKLSQEKLKKLNDDIKTASKTTSSSKWEPKYGNIKLLKSKTIKAYTEFIISPENTFNELKRNFNINNIESLYYIHMTTGDIFYKDNILFYGKLDKSTNIYDIKYIFEFDSETHLSSELTELTRGIDSYMRNKTAFVESNIDDKISPIFTAYKTIGNAYKYSHLYDDYSKCFDYSKYIKNEKLSKFIALYNFYERSEKNLNKSYGNISEKYYLIKSNAINQIKNNCGYDQVKQMLGTKLNLELGDLGLTTDDKKMLKIIKNIPKDILERNFSSNNIIRKIPKRDMEPEDKYIINQSNPNEMAIIYDNFGIIDKKVAEEFIEGISSSFSSVDKNVFDCTLINGRIIIEYKTSLGNSKYVSVIGSVDPNDFIIFNEYALIYKDYNGFSSHTITLKSKLNNFLQQLQLFNGTQPITDSQFNEFGTLIQIEQTGNRPTPIKPSTSPIIPNPSPFTPSPNPPPPKPSPINDEYNLNSKLNISSIRQYFTYPPLIGLENIGATCYMNATLQCLCNIEKLVDYFKYNKHLIEIVKNDYYKKKLCSSFKLLTEKLWPDNFMQKRSTYYAPHDFKDNISTKNPLFQGVAANDSKDLVNFLIMTLHDELNKAKNFGGMGASFADQRNQQVMLNNFIKNFQATNQSIISDLFYAVNCNIIQCSLCKTQTFNYQTYFFIIFPLEEVRKFKFSNNFNQFNNFNNMFNNSEVNIYDCFEYDKKITYMSGENAMHCNYCQRTCNSSMCTLLTTGPEILILILNRGKGIEYNVKINFVERLNLANYIQFSNTGVNYELIGVITHMGESSMSGHFIAYCKSPISKTWFRYNDATVNPVRNFKSEVIDYAMPYLLFYQKMH